MQFAIEIKRDTDGRWIAEIPNLPGVLAYGRTEARARTEVYALALRVIADRRRQAFLLLDQGFRMGGRNAASRDELHER